MHRRSALVAAPSNDGGGAPRAANAARFSGCSTSQVLTCDVTSSSAVGRSLPS